MTTSTKLASPEHTRHRFLVLDAMRGIAALAVVTLHAAPIINKVFLPHAYLAVDFFFLLSGFVISYAYGHKLDAGWPIATFFKARFARLYPMYFLGLLLGIVASLHTANAMHLPLYSLTGLFMVPLLHKETVAFPLNFPTWSLFGEIVANILHAFFLRNRSTRALVLWMSASGLIFGATIFHHGDAAFGFLNLDVLLGLSRVLFSYIAGMLLERWWSRQHAQAHTTNRVPAIVPFALLLLVFAIPSHLFGTDRIPATDLALTFLVLPAILALSTRSYAGTLLHKPSVLLGIVSYAVYILHVPLTSLVTRIVSHRHLPPLALYTADILLVLAISLAVEYLYDRPLRTRLRTYLHA